MAALSDLFIIVIGIFLAITSAILLICAFFVKRRLKAWMLFGSLLFCLLFFAYKTRLKNADKERQITRVGKYYLDKYPNCVNCVLELKEDMTYEVRSEAMVIEQSNWHYETGGDFWRVWLDNGRHQLGSDIYSYQRYKLKYADDSR